MLAALVGIVLAGQTLHHLPIKQLPNLEACEQEKEKVLTYYKENPNPMWNGMTVQCIVVKDESEKSGVEKSSVVVKSSVKEEICREFLKKYKDPTASATSKYAILNRMKNIGCMNEK